MIASASTTRDRERAQSATIQLWKLTNFDTLSLRDFAIELASALSEAGDAARNGSAAGMMGALGKAKKAADDLVDNLETS